MKIANTRINWRAEGQFISSPQRKGLEFTVLRITKEDLLKFQQEMASTGSDHYEHILKANDFISGGPIFPKVSLDEIFVILRFEKYAGSDELTVTDAQVSHSDYFNACVKHYERINRSERTYDAL